MCLESIHFSKPTYPMRLEMFEERLKNSREENMNQTK